MTKAEYDAKLAAINDAWAKACVKTWAKADDKAAEAWTTAYDEAYKAYDEARKARADLDIEFAKREG